MVTKKNSKVITEIEKGTSSLSSMVEFILKTRSIADIKAMITAYTTYIVKASSKNRKKRAIEIAISNLTYCAGYYPSKDCNKIRAKIFKAMQ